MSGIGSGSGTARLSTASQIHEPGPSPSEQLHVSSKRTVCSAPLSTNRRTDGSPFTFSISQTRSVASPPGTETDTETPFVTAEIETVRPSAPDAEICREDSEDTSVTVASGRPVTENVPVPTETGPSLANHTKPAT